MARMMAKARWTQKPSWYCCPGHDPNWYDKGSQRAKENRQWQKEAEGEAMGALVDFFAQKWRAQENDLIGGWCVTPAADPRTPADGAPMLAEFCSEEIAQHVAEIHNAGLESKGEKQ